MQTFFRSLERRFGGIESIVDKNAKVITDTVLKNSALNDLFHHRAIAVHVKGFYPIEQCKLQSELMLKDTNKMNWYVSKGTGEGEESDVQAIGLPHNVAAIQGKLDEYFQTSLSETRKYRIENKLLSPMDKFRLELDEVWKDGCNLLKSKSHSFLPHRAGVVRIMKPNPRHDPSRWTRGFAHVDELELMRTDRGLYSANIYLQQPHSGGELQIWPITFTNRWDFYRNSPTLSLCLSQDYASQQLLRERLPNPLTIRPEAGDLVIICTQRPHAVRGPILGNTRVSVQAFLQYNKDNSIKIEG